MDRRNHEANTRWSELFRNLKDARLRDAYGLFLLESPRVIQTAAEIGLPVRCVLTTESHWERLAPLLPEAEVLLVEAQEVNEIAGYRVRGALALADRPAREAHSVSALDHLIQAKGARVVLADRVSDPDNIGSLFRNATSLGADAVVLSPGCCDPLYRKVIRTSMGTVFKMPYVIAEDWEATLDWLRHTLGLRLIAAETGTGARPLSELQPSARLGILFGSEGEGLGPVSRAAVEAMYEIPMSGEVPSMNVAASSAVFLYEVGRARS